MMQVDLVRQLVPASLPSHRPEALRYEALEKGGSGRLFVRVIDAESDQTWVAMAYTGERPDNARFASITDFLCHHGIAAPAIVARREELGFLLVEDLGNVDLGSFAGEDWAGVLRPAYEAALRTVFDLHRIAETNPPPDLPELEFCFNAQLYQWEQDYFFKQYVSRFESEKAMSLRQDPSLAGLRDALAAEPRFLVHRDFQSTNVMYHRGRCYLIDYQGLRFGVPEYDAASMIFDPYMDLSEGQREELIGYYFGLKQQAGHGESFESYRKRFNACAAQRLMQALGAYGFLGIARGKEDFLQHIRPARERLLRVAREVCPVLEEVLAGKGTE